MNKEDQFSPALLSDELTSLPPSAENVIHTNSVEDDTIIVSSATPTTTAMVPVEMLQQVLRLQQAQSTQLAELSLRVGQLCALLNQHGFLGAGPKENEQKALRLNVERDMVEKATDESTEHGSTTTGRFVRHTHIDIPSQKPLCQSKKNNSPIAEHHHTNRACAVPDLNLATTSIKEQQTSASKSTDLVEAKGAKTPTETLCENWKMLVISGWKASGVNNMKENVPKNAIGTNPDPFQKLHRQIGDLICLSAEVDVMALVPDIPLPAMDNADKPFTAATVNEWNPVCRRPLLSQFIRHRYDHGVRSALGCPRQLRWTVVDVGPGTDGDTPLHHLVTNHYSLTHYLPIVLERLGGSGTAVSSPADKLGSSCNESSKEPLSSNRGLVLPRDRVEWGKKNKHGHSCISVAAAHGLLFAFWQLVQQHRVGYFVHYPGKIFLTQKVDRADFQRLSAEDQERFHIVAAT